jgi:D-alanine-D-alanine ligase
MRIALTHNLKLSNAEEEAEFDAPETIEALSAAMTRAGHRVERIEVSGPASHLVARLEAFAPDLIFNTAEGRRGRMRRGFYPALFEELGMSATGSDAYTLCITLDKTLTKKTLAGFGIPSPRGRLLTRASLRDGGLDDLPFPVIVKPNFEGSSKGIFQTNVAEDAIQLGRVVDQLLAKYPEGVAVERYVPGVDVRVSRIDGLPALPPVEIDIAAEYKRRFNVLDFELKHKRPEAIQFRTLDDKGGGSLAPSIAHRVSALAARAFDALGIRDVGSIDFRVGLDGEVYFLSATAIPSFDPESELFMATRAIGVDYTGAITAVLRAAAARSGLLPVLEATKPRPRSRRTALRVGFAFNMKRIDSAAGDDREAEYDPPETIEAIRAAIESHGHTVVPLEATVDFPRALMKANVDVVLNMAEGIIGRNREAQVPNLCELLGVPFSGSDSATLSICLDKALCKRMLRDVETPAFQILVTGREKLRPFRYPVIVKPNAEGTSKGITLRSVVDDVSKVRELAREIIERYGQPAIVEEYITGREFTVGMLGERRPRVLPPMEVVFLRGHERPVYDYECKQDWEKHVRYDCPATLTKEELRAIERACRTTFMQLGCRDVARIDLRMTPEGRIYVLEVNPLPGLTPDYSDLCLIANATGIDYRTLIGEIMSGAIKRWRERTGTAPSVEPPLLGATGASEPVSTATPSPAAVTNSERDGEAVLAGRDAVAGAPPPAAAN